jgi:predicted nucleotidyltransferase
LNGIGVTLAKLQADLREFIALLNSHNVEYLVVGGHAVAFHGYPRFTGDIDFLIRTTPVNVQRVLRVLQAFGFGELGIGEGDVVEAGRIVQLGHPPNRIDLLTSISGVDFESAWESRVETMMDDQPVKLIGWEDLVLNKRASGRQKDLADVEKLLAVRKRKTQS